MKNIISVFAHVFIGLIIILAFTQLAAQETPQTAPQETKQESVQPAQAAQPASPEDNRQPDVKKFGGAWYAYMEFNGEYKLIKEKFEIFRAEFNKQNIKATGPQFITFYNPPSIYKGDELKWATCYYIDKDAEVKPPLMKKYITPIKSVIMIHREGNIWNTFNKVQDFIKANNFVKAWPAYEVYHTDPYGIEVVHPVEE